MHLDHLTEHQVREAELVRRVEQVRRARERLADRASRDDVPPERATRRRSRRLPWRLAPGRSARPPRPGTMSA
ncbi:hypothetical protein [Isoptericola halotolerans]|uniref:Uncharacterized protein n=1 Tax=Isoptericola halotolerans TaxID=300560 RepID=A0ABX2A8I4_9MICO|nr:hypothetical protein [Isoptericola halotolerans]NOV99015.1 hypothetical protein [Isoptericola halotolerans]